jgi:hypothetical protein
MIEIVIVVFKFIMWIFVAGMLLSGIWVLWVYASDLPSHSEMTEEEELRMAEEMKKNGLRASEIGGDHD